MSAFDLFSIIGTIASIASAFWAFFEARKATRSASQAQSLRNELIERRMLIEVSQIKSETARILKTLATIGPTCTKQQIRGINCNSIAKEVEEYSRLLNEQSQHFNRDFENRALILCKELRQDIATLAISKEFETIKEVGSRMHYKILDFQPVTKNLSDEKKERSPSI
ncbi:hypothetical protein PSGK_19075 [Pseudomonas solani]|uniref:hypothetical protein n=1 Tax=Pseudomonas solani TaxID=2731552 RepID=UPI0035BE1760